MSSRKLKEARNVVFVVNVAVPNDEGVNHDYLENAKEYMVRAIEKKIFIKPFDQIGIIVMGMEDEDICVLQDIQVASFGMIPKINALKRREGLFCDWLEAIRGAFNCIQENVGHSPNCNWQIFLITNYEDDPTLEFEGFTEMVNRCSGCGLLINCIGSKDLRYMENAELNKNEKEILKFCSQVATATYMTFDLLLPQLKFFESDIKKSCPWKCDLELFNIKIPTSTHNKVNRLPSEKTWTLVAVENANGERIEPVELEKARDLLDSENKAHDPEDTIKGYQYGRKFIPVTEDDESGMNLPYEEKSFKLYGVADANTVGFKYRTETHTWIVLPEEGCEERFFYLLMAMKSLNLVGFVRRVYNAGNPPTMNILVPCMDHPELPWCFLMYQLIYSEEEGVIEAESLEEEMGELLEEQKNAVEGIIDSMFVDGDREDTTFKFVPAPDQQHLFEIMCFRALHPDEPLPPPQDHVMALLEPPATVDLENLKDQVEKVRDLFDLEEEEDDDVIEIYPEPGATKMEIDGNAPMKSSQKQSQKEVKSQIK